MSSKACFSKRFITCHLWHVPSVALHLYKLLHGLVSKDSFLLLAISNFLTTFFPLSTVTTTTILSCPQNGKTWDGDFTQNPVGFYDRYRNKSYCQSNGLDMPTQGSLCEGPNVQTSNLISIAREWLPTQVRSSYCIQIIDIVWFLCMDVLWPQHLSSPPRSSPHSRAPRAEHLVNPSPLFTVGMLVLWKCRQERWGVG